MYYLLVYDIKEDLMHKQKLRKVAKVCEDYGVRIQDSVFELNIQQKDFLALKNKLEQIIDPSIDSIRIYQLGKTYCDKTTVLGKRETFEQILDDGLFF